MPGLSSYVDDATSGPVVPPLRSRYQFQKPDRMHVRGSLGSEEIWIGRTTYTRHGPGSAWQAEDTGTALRVGEFIWDGGLPSSVHRLGEQGLGAAHVTEISFFEL